jgi:hypothetical protein
VLRNLKRGTAAEGLSSVVSLVIWLGEHPLCPVRSAPA